MEHWSMEMSEYGSMNHGNVLVWRHESWNIGAWKCLSMEA